MKCTDRELLEKLLRLKERADQRRSAQETMRARTATRLPLRAEIHVSIQEPVVRESRATGEGDRVASASTSEVGSEGSIRSSREPQSSSPERRGAAASAGRLCA